MPDERFDLMNPDDDRVLGAALRAMPTLTPRESEWSTLAAELAKTPRPLHAPRRRWPTWIGLAATLLAAVVGVRLLMPQQVHVEGTAHQPSPETLALIQQSQQLDETLAMLDARSVPIDGTSAMASAELENLIGLTDLQLNAVSRDDEAQALWSRRVDLMTRLANARTTTRFDALSDNGNAYLQNATYRID